MKTFKELIKNDIYRTLQKDIESDLIDLFINNYENDDIEILEDHEVIEKLDYDGRLHELIDSSIDIYYYDLRKWSVDNYLYIDEAIDQGLIEKDTDFHHQIQIGQYVYFQEYYYNQVTELVEKLNELIEAV